jgi:hypothetical protein
MSAIRRAIALTPALVIGMMACDLFSPNKIPDDAPGVAVSGLGTICPSSSDCLAWTADSKTVYLFTGFSTNGPSLVALDPATKAVRLVGSVAITARAPVVAPDGATIFFSVPGQASGYDVNRMSVATGVATLVTTASSSNILITPDGSAIAFHAAGSGVADTIVLLDLASGARRATTIMKRNVLRSWASDGTRLILNVVPPSDLVAVQIWHVDTGVRDTIPSGAWTPLLRDLRWSGGAFRALFATNPSTPVYTDTSLSGGPAITYRPPATDRVVWLPDRSAIMAITDRLFCGEQDCNIDRFEFLYVTATKSSIFGSINGRTLPVLAVSPDGHWVAYEESSGPLYLLSR